MNNAQRKEIIATLINAGKPELANLMVALRRGILKRGEMKALDKAIEGLEQADGNLRAVGHFDYFLDRIEPMIKEMKELKRYA